MIGYSKCPIWLKEAYRKAVKNVCEMCNKPESQVGILQVHRKLRGHKGGKYTPSNCQIICKKCHRNVHYREF
jgi:hypothetical protein